MALTAKSRLLITFSCGCSKMFGVGDILVPFCQDHQDWGAQELKDHVKIRSNTLFTEFLLTSPERSPGGVYQLYSIKMRLRISQKS